jgi:hypothetical protein
MQQGATMTNLVESTTKLGYLINDADEHSTPPTSAYQQYIDPDKRARPSPTSDATTDVMR